MEVLNSIDFAVICNIGEDLARQVLNKIGRPSILPDIIVKIFGGTRSVFNG